MGIESRNRRLWYKVLPSCLAVAAALLVGAASCEPPGSLPLSAEVVFVTWNVRGYPEAEAEKKEWFYAELGRLDPDVLCVQEIANQGRVEEFLQAEPAFTQAAFLDSSDGQDNAIFAQGSAVLQDLPDPTGFQHPAQAALVSKDGFDAVVITVHLSWTDVARREAEKQSLKQVVSQASMIDPDVVVVGDFNTEGADIENLAQALGLEVMTPAGQEGVGTTYAGHRYDHLRVSPDLALEEAVSCSIQTYAGADLAAAQSVSDHRPVEARFKTDRPYRDRP